MKDVDLSGDISETSNTLSLTIDVTPPTGDLTGQRLPSIGDLNAGHVVTLTLNMSEAVTVNTTGGTPTLTLNDGGTATYTGGSGTSALTFSYTVAAGQNTPDLTVSAVNLNGATIADAAGNNAALSGTFNPTGTLQIDTTPPSPPVISTDAINANNSITLTGTAEANSNVTVYDDQTELGTTTAANANGTWTYTTGTFGSGAQVFTATATDAAGNTSAPRIPLIRLLFRRQRPKSMQSTTRSCNVPLLSTEVTASLAIDSTLGSAGMIAAVVNSVGGNQQCLSYLANV